MSARKPKSAAEILASQAPVVSWAIPETPIRPILNRDRPDSGSPSPFTAAGHTPNTLHTFPSSSPAVFPFTFHSDSPPSQLLDWPRWQHHTPDTFDSPGLLSAPPSISSHCPRCLCASRGESTTLRQRYLNVSEYLRAARVSPIDYLLHTLTAMDDRTAAYKHALYQVDGKLLELLDVVEEDVRGKARLRDWMSTRERALDLICDSVNTEMHAAKSTLQVAATHITPQYIDLWTFSPTTGMATLSTVAPVTFKILRRAAETDRARGQNKIKHSNQVRQPNIFIYDNTNTYLLQFKLCGILLAQLAKSRSQLANNFQIIFSLFTWSNGCSRLTSNALHATGMSMSFDSTQQIVERLGRLCLDLAVEVSDGYHELCWDNINMKRSKFYEQRENGPPKVSSGTVAILYKVVGANPEYMHVKPMLERAATAADLSWKHDIRPTPEQYASFHFQCKIHVVRILTTHATPFQYLSDHPSLQHQSRKPVPVDFKSEQFPLRATTFNEATISGTIQFIDNVYGEQLKKTAADIGDKAIPSTNDQLSNARFRSAKAMRRGDLTHLGRLENFQIGFGIFHAIMNFIWGLLNHHRGSIAHIGSLAYWFEVLDKSRLGNKEPDYHTLLAALKQIFEGVILDAWRIECGFESIDAFAASEPSPETLLRIASQILLNHATPIPEGASAAQDIARRNLILLIRDLLYAMELVRATKDGDFGRIEDILGQLAMLYKGIGCKNYCTEMLHYIHNLKRVWGEGFGDIMGRAMLKNMSGVPGNCMGTDLNIEHVIRFLKVGSLETNGIYITHAGQFLFANHGLHSSWDRLGDISASANYLMKIKTALGPALGKYQGSTHTTPDTSSLVLRVAEKMSEIELNKAVLSRVGNDVARPVEDILSKGERELKSATLNTFNKNIRKARSGVIIEEEQDDIAPVAFAEQPEQARPEEYAEGDVLYEDY
ncbi:hypothetical protein HWV62_36286 [Athelia sp. TMB]|nr:hypothetical protein HWV62_36286 [Athelia sp. TMB]